MWYIIYYTIYPITLGSTKLTERQKQLIKNSVLLVSCLTTNHTTMEMVRNLTSLQIAGAVSCIKYCYGAFIKTMHSENFSALRPEAMEGRKDDFRALGAGLL